MGTSISLGARALVAMGAPPWRQDRLRADPAQDIRHLRGMGLRAGQDVSLWARTRPGEGNWDQIQSQDGQAGHGDRDRPRLDWDISPAQQAPCAGWAGLRRARDQHFAAALLGQGLTALRGLNWGPGLWAGWGKPQGGWAGTVRAGGILRVPVGTSSNAMKTCKWFYSWFRPKVLVASKHVQEFPEPVPPTVLATKMPFIYGC